MPVSYSDLWLAILLAGVFCWLASAVIHMVIKHHNSDYKELSNEADVASALRAGNPAPALYTMPHCIDMKQMGEESMQKKFNDGPVAMISVMPNGMPAMGKSLGLQFAFFLLGAALIACLAASTISAGAEYMTVFKFVFLAAFLTYGWAEIPYSIWMGQPWANTARYLIDAVIYGAVTAGTFGWLWPGLS